MTKQRGMALLMVLMMMSLMAIVAVNMNDYWQRSLARTQMQQEGIRAKWLLLGGEIYAKNRLQQAGQERNTWGTQGETLSMRTEEGTVAIHLRRADACFNVNALIRADAPEDADHGKRATHSKERQIFILLMNNLGMTETEAGTIADAIVARAYEEGHLMGDLSELRELDGIDREHYLRMAPQLCAAPDADLRINLNALSESRLPLLRAMLMNALNDERLRALFAARPSPGWQTLAFLSEEKALQALSDDSLPERLSFDDKRWIAELQVTLNDGQYRLTSVLQPGKSEVVVVSRQFGRGDR